MSRIKNRLATRGARGFLNLQRQFKILDADKDGLVNIYEFKKAIKDMRIEVTDLEIDLVFSFFDLNGENIDYLAFLSILKGELKHNRLTLILQAFNQIDLDEDQLVLASQCKQLYNARAHPEVKNGRKNSEDLLNEFIESMLFLHNLNGGHGNEIISKEEFIEYFANISASIQDDLYFETMMTSVFKLSNESSL